jgi:glycosyltransferase involved in cell wall biosynthesis
VRTIVILTASPLCRNPRVLKEASALGAAGYNVTVLTISQQERFERFDRELLARAPFRRVALDYTGAGLGARGRAWLQRAHTRGARLLLERVGVETAGALGPAGALLRLARAHPADLTIAHTEIPTWIATHLIREGRRVAVDFEDWYSEDLLPEDRRGRPVRLLREAEDFVLRHAAYASATSQSMATALASAFRCPPPTVIRNVFPLQPLSRVDRAVGDQPPALIWFSQTIGPGRGLEAFVRAWARTTTPSRLALLGEARPGFRESLLRDLPSSHRPRLEFLPLVSPDALPGKLAEFDLGLAVEQRTPLNRDVTITNKLFQYCNAGLAVIATATQGQREVMAAHPEIGILLESLESDAWAAQLDQLLSDRPRWRRMQEAARAAARAELCWEHETQRLLAAVRAAWEKS